MLRSFKLGLAAGLAVTMTGTTSFAEKYIDLGGPATGFLAVSNIKNSSTQNGIEGKNLDGSINTGHNGLPDYPNFQIPAGFNNGGVWTAIIASPQSTANDYQAFIDAFYPGENPTINNQVVTQPDAASFSAGRIHYDNSVHNTTGTVTIPVSQLTLDFNTFEWDGSLNGDGGFEGQPTPGRDADNPRSILSNGTTGVPVTRMISPFSPVYTIYNDANGFGNAAIWYEISVTNLTGSGLTFEDGELVSMDIAGDLIVGLKLGQAPGFPPVLFGEGTDDANPAGSFTASGLNYEFDLKDTEGAVIFSGINMLFNRAGTASVIPEPASLTLLGVCGAVVLVRRRRRA